MEGQLLNAMTDQMKLAKEALEMWRDSYTKHPHLDQFEGSVDKREKFFDQFYTKDDLEKQIQYYTELIERSGTDYYLGQYYYEILDAERYLKMIEERPKYFFAHCHMSRQRMSKWYEMYCHPKKRWIYFCGEIKVFSKIHFGGHPSGHGIYREGCEKFEVFQTLEEMEIYILKYFKAKLVFSYQSYVIISVPDEEKKHFIGSKGSHIKMVQSLLGKRIVLK